MTDNPLSRRTLEELPGRVLTFLRGVGLSPAIRASLARCGYTEAEHGLGWALVHKVAGFSPEPSSFGPDGDPAVRAAILELDAWDEPNFARIRAILERGYPAQAAFVFDQLEPAQGVAAVVAVATLLKRLDQLERGEERKATRKEDQAALARLDSRGYDKAERKRLAALVGTAERGANAVEEEETETRVKARTDHESTLMELHGWYREWSTTARAVIRRRDQLIRLGLARRKKRDAPDDATDSAGPAGPAAPTAPATPTTGGATAAANG